MPGQLLARPHPLAGPQPRNLQAALRVENAGLHGHVAARAAVVGQAGHSAQARWLHVHRAVRLRVVADDQGQRQAGVCDGQGVGWWWGLWLRDKDMRGAALALHVVTARLSNSPRCMAGCHRLHAWS